MRRLSLVAFVVLALDLVSKAMAVRGLSGRLEPVQLLGTTVRLIYVRNTGSAFSLFEGGRFFFIAFSVVSIVLIILLARNPRYRTPAYGFSLGMILGGAIGNLVDRIAYGSVTDWIDVGIGFHRWPTFNVADIGVSVGVILLAFLTLRRKEDAPSGPDGAAP